MKQAINSNTNIIEAWHRANSRFIQYIQHNAQQGFTFLEVLIAFALLSTTIIASISSIAIAKGSSFGATQRTLATMLANDLIQKMQVNRVAVNQGDYSGTFSDFTLNPNINACSDIKLPCDAAQVATYDLYQWQMAIFGADVRQQQAFIGGLVNPTACVDINARAVSVVISWQGRMPLNKIKKQHWQPQNHCDHPSDGRHYVHLESFINPINPTSAE